MTDGWTDGLVKWKRKWKRFLHYFCFNIAANGWRQLGICAKILYELPVHTHTPRHSLSLFLCRTHTYGCTHKNRLLFLWKTGQQPHGQQTCVWRMCSLTHTISILCSVWLCVLECVLTVPCVLVCVCVWQCVWCACQCVGVCVCLSFPLRPSRHVRQGQSQSVPLHFQPKQFQIMFGKQQQQQQQHIHSHSHIHTPIHTHTYSAAIKSLWFRRAIK